MSARTGTAAAALAVVVLGLSAAALALSPEPDDPGGAAGGSMNTGGAHAGGAVHSAVADGSGMGVGPPPVWDDGTPAVPTRHTGPQGAVGQFVARCGYSHSGQFDPIVWPGQPGRSHNHDFYGSTQTDDFSTPEALEGTETTCNKPGDSAGYWQPALYDGDTAVEPVQIHAYYRAAPGVDPDDVVPFPFGIALIAGDALATTPQVGEAAGWACGAQTSLLAEPPECPVTAPLHLVLTFPDCWDGENLDSPNHRDHATYSADGRCPPSHPVNVPQLTMSVKFPVSGPGHDLRLASGNVYSAHGDFFNAWDPAALRREVEHCIQRDVVCDLASNREEDGPFFTQ